MAQRQHDFVSKADRLVDAVRAVELDAKDMDAIATAAWELGGDGQLSPRAKRGYLAVLRRIQQRIDRLQEAVDAARTDARGR